MFYKKVLFSALVFAVTVAASVSQAAARGLSVELRASETKDAPVSKKVKLYGSSYALVIGNDAYTGSWPRLSNAVKDARLVAAALRAKGFEVTLKTDLKSQELVDAFETFFYETGDDPDARLFVWYAGHGHSERSEGYLVPVDAPDPGEGGIFKRKALSLRRMGEYVRDSKALHVLAVFDSCFAGTIFNVGRAKPPAAITHATTRPVRQFLTSGDAGQEVADDGTFRKLFIRAINGENRADANRDGYLAASELGLFMTDRITNYSNGGQTPRNGKLNDPDLDLGDFVFQVNTTINVHVTTTSPPTSGGVDKETIFWQSIEDSQDVDSYQAYLDTYPSGSFSALARVRLKRLDSAQVAAITPPDVAVPSPETPVIGVYPTGRKPGDVFRDCTDCPEMVVIPRGRFRMGDLSGDLDDKERPVHDVSINYSFAVGKYEVTRSEFALFISATGRGSGEGCMYWIPRASREEYDLRKNWRNPGFSQSDRDPVVCVSWDDAQAYVRWISDETGQEYRLLSESEWEYVARSSSILKYSFGNMESELCGHGNGADLSTEISGRNKSCDDDYGERTSPVGSFKPNGLGLYDMHGNVSEWVDDCWHYNYRGSPKDGSSWTSGGVCGRRVVRGGSYFNGPLVLRAAYRIWSYKDRNNDRGFRIARALKTQQFASLTAPNGSIEEINESYAVLKTANIRSEPSKTSKKIGVLPKDTAVTVTGKIYDGKWLRVKQAVGRVGYVLGSLLTPYDPSEIIAWSKVQNTKSADEIAAFLRSYPTGLFAEKAKALKAELTPQMAAISLPKVSVPSSSTPVVGVYPTGRKPGDVFRDCTDCPEMVVIPRGRFRMGDLSGDGDDKERPVHDVSINYSFAVGKYEVTQDEWLLVMNLLGPSHFTGGQYPVEGTTWNDAQEFVKNLSARTGEKYRLLSESEWEYVARAGTSTKFSFGKNISTGDANYDRFLRRTTRVGSYRANGFGLYDMHGNVWEWVEDCWHESYRRSPTDGSSWTNEGDCGRRVRRGGAWGQKPKYLRAATRSSNREGDRSSYIGFRIARTLSR